MKTCTNCGQGKPPEQFAIDRSKRDGRDSWCRACKNEARKSRYYAKHEHEKQRSKDYYVSKPDAVKERQRNRNREYASRIYASLSPDERWALELKKAHGLYPDQWLAMWEKQEGLCYLGLHPLPEDRSKVFVDHDHRHCPRGRSCSLCRRGLACHPCNSAIGLLGEDPERLRIVADQLERAQVVVNALLMGSPDRQDVLFQLADE